MLASGGYKIILFTAVILCLSIALTYLFPSILLKIVSVLIGIIFLFNFYFFRDPHRDIPKGEKLILSPADGKVVNIDEVYEPYYFNSKVKRLSIFLSVFDVHVNRIPISGRVDFLKYIKGKFMVAYDDKASEDNEQSIIGISNGSNKLLFKQIAGIVARRIEYSVAEGDSVSAGERFGLIRYGSRVDMFFPANVVLKAKMHEHVYGGISVIGEFE